MEDQNELPEVEIEDIDLEDYEMDTIRIRKTLRIRTFAVVFAVFAFFILRIFDNNIDFNNVNSSLFIYICSAIVILATFIYFIDQSVHPQTYKNKNVFKKYKLLNEILDVASVVPYLAVLVTITNMFFVSLSPITGTSMMPNFTDDEAVIFSHTNNAYERFDVVIVKQDSVTSPYLIKRVIGLPGETVRIASNEIYINNILLGQDFIDQDVVKTYCTNTIIDEFGVYIDSEHCSFDVPSENYFVMGDNRDGSAVGSNSFSIDSRYFGPVTSENIYGKVIFKFKDYNLIK